METKLFEVRDHGTIIPVLAIKTLGGDHEPSEAEAYLWKWSGYYGDNPYVILVSINPEVGLDVQFDSYEWRKGRTLGIAHNYIEEHFDELESGAVVDVAFIRGETQTPKTPQRLGRKAAS